MSAYIVDITKPPFPPPSRTFKDGFFFSGETKESIKRKRDWEDYMTKYKFQLELNSMKTEKNLIQDINFKSTFYKNCKKNRKRESKICQDCPFRDYIEIKEIKYGK